MKQIKGLATTGMTLGLLMFSAPSLAVLVENGGVMCGEDSDKRQMTLSPDSGTATCVNSDASPMSALNDFHKDDLGLTELGKLEADGDIEGSHSKEHPLFSVNGLDWTSGSISFDQGLYDNYSDVHVSFYFGNQNEPDNWFSYALDNVFSADWDTDWEEGQWALSNVALWGNDRERTVPEPLTLGLLGAGLFALGLASRRSRRNDAAV